MTLSRLHDTITPFNRGRTPPQLLTEAAHGCLEPPPTRRLRRAHLHLPYSMTISRLLDTTLARHEPSVVTVDVQQAAKAIVLQFIYPVGMADWLLQSGQRRWRNLRQQHCDVFILIAA